MTPQHFDAWLIDPARRPLVMGVLNVTPDSFSDGGKFATSDAAITHAEQMTADGADLIDIGGESTRPGAQPVDADEQVRRVVPVIKALAGRMLFSIDTMSAKVAEAAVDAGARIVNDVSGGVDDPQMLDTVAKLDVPVILMHSPARPLGMQYSSSYDASNSPSYHDVTVQIGDFLKSQAAAAVQRGVKPHHILFDPGIGFGKTIDQNMELMRRLPELAKLGKPLVLGTSRKSFIGKITDEPDPTNRLFGTAASVAWCVANGADIVRVHDVKQMAQVVKMTVAIRYGYSP